MLGVDMNRGLLAVYCVGVALVAALHSYTIDVWADYEPDPGPWCEADRGPAAFLREPSNAMSDFAYLWLAFWLLSTASRTGLPCCLALLTLL